MRRSRTLIALVLLAALAAPAPAGPDGAAAPLGVRTCVQTAATRLAAAGRRDDVAEAIALLGRFGEDPASLRALRASCEAALAKAPEPAPAVPDAAGMFREAANQLYATLESKDDSVRKSRAEWIVQLDGSNESAHDELGDSFLLGAWRTDEQSKCFLRRSEIAGAVAAARRLDVRLEQDGGGDPRIFTLTLTRPFRVVWNRAEVHAATLPKHRVARIVTAAVRALALSNYVRRGKLVAPPLVQAGKKIVLWGSPALRKDVVANLQKHELLKAEEAARVEGQNLAAFEDAERAVHVFDDSDGAMAAYVAYHIWCQLGYEQYEGDPHQCILVGHLDWALRSVADATFPPLGGGPRVVAPRVRPANDPERAEREDLQALSLRGMAGPRAWMRDLARRGADPTWGRTLTDEVERISGNELLKSMLVAEYAQEFRKMDALFRDTRGRAASPSTFEPVLGGSDAAIEARWRSWLVGRGEGLAQRAERPAASAPSPEVRRMLARLDVLRRAAVRGENGALVLPLRLESELSDGCRRHAAYLAANPKQQTAWPDLEDEVPDRPGFSAEGCRAGVASVIRTGAKSPDQVLDGWMASFHGRLPLLDAGLRRVGFALEEGVAVLDVRSLVEPLPSGIWCAWPPAGATDVPLRHASVLPAPVPGVDPETLGFPVTVQVCSDDLEPALKMTLTAGGKPVECHVSTPESPANPACAPRGAWALLPKKPLAPGTVYTVAVEGLPGERRAEWTFTTAKQ